MKKEEEGRFTTISDLEAFYNEVKTYWSDVNLRNIGHIEYAAPVAVDSDEGGTQYTEDWAVFLADESKVKDHFEGNVVDIGSKHSITDLFAMFGSGGNPFEVWDGRRQQIVGCATKGDLQSKFAELDSEGQECSGLMVGKNGSTTDLTMGCYAGLESFIRNDIGIESMELGIYNSGVNIVKGAEVFSAKGDSGSLVWHARNGEGFIVGQVHSGSNKGGSTSNHLTYCTPGWYLLDQIRKEFPHADFYRTAW